MRYAYLPDRHGRIGVGLTGPGSQHRYGAVVDVSEQVGERHPHLYRCAPATVPAPVEVIITPVTPAAYDVMSAADVRALARAAGATTRESGSKPRAIEYLTQ